MQHRISKLAATAILAMTPLLATVSHADADAKGILPVDGNKICQGNQCLRVDASTGRMQLAGRKSAAIPAGIDVSSGSVTTAEFRQMMQVASLTSALGAGRR